MQKLVRDYLNELNRKQKKRRKAGMATLLLVVLVIGAVIGTLTQYGVAMTGNAKCGLEEHQHTADCYSEMLTCGQEESVGHTHTEECALPAELVCGLEESEGQDGVEDHLHSEECYAVPEGWGCGQEESAGHTHTDACYTSALSCGKDEHTHTDACYIDKQADVEKAEDWDAQYADVEWTNNWGEDLVTAASMQVGYEESRDNYEVAEDGSHNGYTRYGQFADEPYVDNWDAAFVNFCLHYAGLEESNLFPETRDSEKWQEEFNKIEEENSSYLTKAADYTPEPGDIVFLNQENEETPVQMGIVSGYDQTSGEVTVIQGDSEESVKENQYTAEDIKNAEYLKTGEMEEAVQPDDQDGQQEETPAETNGAEDGAPETDGNTNDENGTARVKDFKILGVVDGSAPFDDPPKSDDGRTLSTAVNNKTYIPGDDVDENNGIVRTFDTVQYEFRVDMASKDESKVHNEARINLKFFLPVSDKEVEFVKDAMPWLKNYNVEPVKDENGTVNGQMLTGYVNLKSETRNVVPGSYANTVTIKIKNMKNEATLCPTFSAAMESNTSDEWKEIPAGEVTISAAQKYNVHIDAMNSYIGEFDFSTGDAPSEDDTKGNGAANYKNNSTFVGKAVKVGVALQLYNDSAAKEMKGIELPEEGKPITFDLEINSKCGKDEESAVSVDEVTTWSKYTPRLWSFEGSQKHESGEGDQYGRQLNDLDWSRSMVPDNKYEEASGVTKEGSCYDGGLWYAQQKKDGEGNLTNKVTVTVEDWKIDLEQMPKKNGISYDTEDVYDANVGCFSAGEFVFVQPFNYENHIEEKYQIQWEAGISDLLFYMGIKVADNGKVKVGDAEHISKTNNEVKKNFGLTEPGVLRNEVAFLKQGEKWLSPGYDEEEYKGGYYGHGDSYALIGETIDLAAGVTYMPGNGDRMCWATNLMKFDSGKLELTGKYHSNFGSESHNRASLDGEGMTKENTRIYYATKIDGSAWKDRYEMKATYEDKLMFYPSLEAIPEDYVCVGILTCFKGKGSAEKIEAMYQVAHEAKVVEDNDEIIGETCVVVSTSRAWPESVFKEEDLDPKSIAFPKNVFSGCISGLPKKHMRNANTPGYGWVTYNSVNKQSEIILQWDETPDDIFYDSSFSHPLPYEPGKSIRSEMTRWDYKNNEYCIEAFNKGLGTTIVFGPCGENVGRFYQETTYTNGENGIVATQHNSNQMDTGDTLLILGYESKITKSSIQTVAGEDGKKGVKETFNLNEDQRVVDYKLEPKIDLKKGIGKDSDKETTVTIVDILPEHTAYIDGSTYFGGEYQQVSPEGGKQGKITGGLGGVKEKKISNKEEWKAEWTIKDSNNNDIKVTQTREKNTDGRWKLSWTIENMPVNRKMDAIYYSVKIQNSVVGGKTTVPLKNTVYITSTDDRRATKAENGNFAEKEVKATYAIQESHGKIVNQTIVEENGEIDYTVYYNNFLDAKQRALFVDLMPRNNVALGTGDDYKSRFKGSYEVSKCTLDIENENNIEIYYTVVDNVDTNISEEQIKTSENVWKKATINKENGEITFDSNQLPTAWAAFGNVEPGGSIHVNLKIKLNLELENYGKSSETNHVVNAVSGVSGNKYVTTETVRRVLEGLAWQDDNRNGLQDSDETLLNGVTVQLLKWDKEEEKYEQVFYESEGGSTGPVEIKTGQQVSVRSQETIRTCELPEDAKERGVNGYYRFMDLPPGTYAVRFKAPNAKEGIKYKATKVDAENNEKDKEDSDGKPKYDEEGNLTYTEISDLKMPTAEEVEKNGESAIYRLKNNDSGFYLNSGLEIQKTDKTGEKNLTGAIFTICEKIKPTEPTEPTESAVSFIKEENGSYTMFDPEEQSAPSEDDEFLIALGDDRSIVMEAHDSAITAEKKSENAGQKFQIYDVEDGYKAVKADGKWMVLTDQGIEMQTLTGDKKLPTEDQFLWEFKKWQNGEYSIISKGGSEKKYVGVGGVNERLQLSDKTDGLRCNFLVIPTAEYGKTTELEVDDNGKLIIGGLRSNASYTIEEIKSPEGCRVLNESVEIKVDGEGMVSLISKIDEVEVTGTTNRAPILQLKIRNNGLYDLPSAGGFGIYWYSIGGMLLMLAAALILYKNKCKEVLGG